MSRNSSTNRRRRSSSSSRRCSRWSCSSSPGRSVVISSSSSSSINGLCNERETILLRWQKTTCCCSPRPSQAGRCNNCISSSSAAFDDAAATPQRGPPCDYYRMEQPQDLQQGLYDETELLQRTSTVDSDVKKKGGDKNGGFDIPKKGCKLMLRPQQRCRYCSVCSRQKQYLFRTLSFVGAASASATLSPYTRTKRQEQEKETIQGSWKGKEEVDDRQHQRVLHKSLCMWQQLCKRRRKDVFLHLKHQQEQPSRPIQQWRGNEYQGQGIINERKGTTRLPPPRWHHHQKQKQKQQEKKEDEEQEEEQKTKFTSERKICRSVSGPSFTGSAGSVTAAATWQSLTNCPTPCSPVETAASVAAGENYARKRGGGAAAALATMPATCEGVSTRQAHMRSTLAATPEAECWGREEAACCSQRAAAAAAVESGRSSAGIIGDNNNKNTSPRSLTREPAAVVVAVKEDTSAAPAAQATSAVAFGEVRIRRRAAGAGLAASPPRTTAGARVAGTGAYVVVTAEASADTERTRRVADSTEVELVKETHEEPTSAPAAVVEFGADFPPWKVSQVAGGSLKVGVGHSIEKDAHHCGRAVRKGTAAQFPSARRKRKKSEGVEVVPLSVVESMLLSVSSVVRQCTYTTQSRKPVFQCFPLRLSRTVRALSIVVLFLFSVPVHVAIDFWLSAGSSVASYFLSSSSRPLHQHVSSEVLRGPPLYTGYREKESFGPDSFHVGGGSHLTALDVQQWSSLGDTDMSAGTNSNTSSSSSAISNGNSTNNSAGTTSSNSSEDDREFTCSDDDSFTCLVPPVAAGAAREVMVVGGRRESHTVVYREARWRGTSTTHENSFLLFAVAASTTSNGEHKSESPPKTTDAEHKTKVGAEGAEATGQIVRETAREGVPAAPRAPPPRPPSPSRHALTSSDRSDAASPESSPSPSSTPSHSPEEAASSSSSSSSSSSLLPGTHGALASSDGSSSEHRITPETPPASAEKSEVTPVTPEESSAPSHGRGAAKDKGVLKGLWKSISKSLSSRSGGNVGRKERLKSTPSAMYFFDKLIDTERKGLTEGEARPPGGIPKEVGSSADAEALGHGAEGMEERSEASISSISPSPPVGHEGHTTERPGPELFHHGQDVQGGEGDGKKYEGEGMEEKRGIVHHGQTEAEMERPEDGKRTEEDSDRDSEYTDSSTSEEEGSDSDKEGASETGRPKGFLAAVTRGTTRGTLNTAGAKAPVRRGGVPGQGTTKTVMKKRTLGHPRKWGIAAGNRRAQRLMPGGRGGGRRIDAGGRTRYTHDGDHGEMTPGTVFGAKQARAQDIGGQGTNVEKAENTGDGTSEKGSGEEEEAGASSGGGNAPVKPSPRRPGTVKILSHHKNVQDEERDSPSGGVRTPEKERNQITGTPESEKKGVVHPEEEDTSEQGRDTDLDEEAEKNKKKPTAPSTAGTGHPREDTSSEYGVWRRNVPISITVGAGGGGGGGPPSGIHKQVGGGGAPHAQEKESEEEYLRGSSKRWRVPGEWSRHLGLAVGPAGLDPVREFLTKQLGGNHSSAATAIGANTTSTAETGGAKNGVQGGASSTFPTPTPTTMSSSSSSSNERRRAAGPSKEGQELSENGIATASGEAGSSSASSSSPSERSSSSLGGGGSTGMTILKLPPAVLKRRRWYLQHRQRLRIRLEERKRQLNTHRQLSAIEKRALQSIFLINQFQRHHMLNLQAAHSQIGSLAAHSGEDGSVGFFLVNECVAIRYADYPATFPGYDEQAESCRCPARWTACSKVDAAATPHSWEPIVRETPGSRCTDTGGEVMLRNMHAYSCADRDYVQPPPDAPPVPADVKDRQCRAAEFVLCKALASKCFTGPWSPWTECSTPCGDGYQYRWRKQVSTVLHHQDDDEDRCAPYHMEERRKCNLGPCPASVVDTHCHWTEVQIERMDYPYDETRRGCKCGSGDPEFDRAEGGGFMVPCTPEEALASMDNWVDLLQSFCQGTLKNLDKWGSNLRFHPYAHLIRVGLANRWYLDCTGGWGKFNIFEDRMFCGKGVNILCRPETDTTRKIFGAQLPHYDVIDSPELSSLLHLKHFSDRSQSSSNSTMTRGEATTFLVVSWMCGCAAAAVLVTCLLKRSVLLRSFWGTQLRKMSEQQQKKYGRKECVGVWAFFPTDEGTTSSRRGNREQRGGAAFYERLYSVFDACATELALAVSAGKEKIIFLLHRSLCMATMAAAHVCRRGSLLLGAHGHARPAYALVGLQQRLINYVREAEEQQARRRALRWSEFSYTPGQWWVPPPGRKVAASTDESSTDSEEEEGEGDLYGGGGVAKKRRFPVGTFYRSGAAEKSREAVGGKKKLKGVLFYRKPKKDRNPHRDEKAGIGQTRGDEEEEEEETAALLHQTKITERKEKQALRRRRRSSSTCSENTRGSTRSSSNDSFTRTYDSSRCSNGGMPLGRRSLDNNHAEKDCCRHRKTSWSNSNGAQESSNTSPTKRRATRGKYSNNNLHGKGSGNNNAEADTVAAAGYIKRPEGEMTLRERIAAFGARKGLSPVETLLIYPRLVLLLRKEKANRQRRNNR